MATDTPSIIGFIPARAGSKRVPSKNVLQLGDHPLIAYTIAAALESCIFDAVVVSTDSAEIADLARHYGAEVPFLRPAEFAADHSPDIEWLDFTLKRLHADGLSFECFSILRPTSPFRQAATIQRAWEQFKNAKGVDSLRAVEKCRQHPGKMWVIHGPFMTPLLPNPPGTPWHSTPYQALPEVYAQNASLEIAWTRVVLEDGTIAGQMLVPFLTNKIEGFDINDSWDWWIAEEMLRRGEAQLPFVSQVAYPGYP